jgi:prolipoprotein diacylglyceryltransferase
MGMALSIPMILYGIYLMVTASRRPPQARQASRAA